MFYCSKCKKKHPSRLEHFLHVATCGKNVATTSTGSSVTNWRTDFDLSNEDSEVDDSDNDLDWCPSSSDTDTSEGNNKDFVSASSPITHEQSQIAKEAELLLVDNFTGHSSQEASPQTVMPTEDAEPVSSPNHYDEQSQTTIEAELIRGRNKDIDNFHHSSQESEIVMSTEKATTTSIRDLTEEYEILKKRLALIENKLAANKGHDTAHPAEGNATPLLTPHDNKSKQPKKYFCVFCKNLVDHFPRHLLNKHKNEDEVVRLSSVAVGSSERKKLLAKLRGDGALLFNTTNELNQGKSITARRQKNDIINNTKPCPICHNFFSKKSLWRHYKNCSGEKHCPRNLQSTSEAILIKSENHKNISDEMKMNILPGMEHDEIYKEITNDQTIIDHGNYLCVTHKEQHNKNMIRTKLRQLAKLTIQMKKIDPEIENLDKSLAPKHYDTFVKAVNSAAGLSGNKYNAPSLVGELGRSMNLVANRRIIYYIKFQNEIRKKEIEQWVHIYKHDFYNTVGRNALRAIQRKKWGKAQLVPITEDIIKLNKHLSESIINAEETFTKGFNEEAFNVLNKCLMAQIQLFNRKRAGEVDKFEIGDFEKRHNVQKDSLFYKTLKPSEKIIADKYMRVETRGKLHLKPASMLLTLKQVELVKLILSHRTRAGIPDSNPFVFARKNSSFKAYTALKEVAYASEAKEPDLLIGTLLRKQIATTAQILNFTDNDNKM